MSSEIEPHYKYVTCIFTEPQCQVLFNIFNGISSPIYNDTRLIGYSFSCNAVVPMPDFFESADFFKPISRKSGSVNTKIGKSVTPNFGTIKIGRV